MPSRTLTLALAAVCVFPACAARQAPAAHPVVSPAAPRAILLLKDTPERETARLKELRQDVEVDTRDADRTPHVVATGQTEPLKLEGARARLYGDAKGTEGFSVDNFLLLEVVDGRGTVLRRAAVGYTDSVLIGNQQVDNVGRRAFAFEPGEVDVTELLPESGEFRVRTTALDYWGVGRVSNVYLVLSPEARRGEDDLRGQ
ncbi:hypothetical protein JGU66_00955 [Myxococcaceae bacterium JPH2]|nr:hypothetical protein [Myxococcaceae bacterium JPH2]